ncbi:MULTISPECIES: hypothetical protein [unclassified Mesorhizobium]|nr:MULTISPECIES: hypothetical protein [unclassified Mesorhizobium]
MIGVPLPVGLGPRFFGITVVAGFIKLWYHSNGPVGSVNFQAGPNRNDDHGRIIEMAADSSTIIPFPLSNIDQQIAEARAVVEMLISMGENAEDAEFLRLRASSVTMLYLITDKLKSADRSIPALYGRGARA